MRTALSILAKSVICVATASVRLQHQSLGFVRSGRGQESCSPTGDAGLAVSSTTQKFSQVGALFSLIVAGTVAAQQVAPNVQQPIIDAPLPPLAAASSMRVPDGFRVTLFAGEPDVQQPIGFCIDDRARLWVAEAYNYPVHGDRSGDRIVIFEDSDGDGRHDKRTVFFDGLNYVTGIEVGFGGAWVMSPPSLYFIPDRDGDDRPDSAPQVVLDGFGNHANAHNLANGFAWGPDGWLYGTHGRTNWSLIGKPGTAESDRIRFDGGVYRIDPVTHHWEPYADGTTNPWGIDWNDWGHAFITNCVNPHLFQVIQGAHYEPWRGRESSQHAYQRIDTIADHLHFVGLRDVRSGLGSTAEDAAGGGHAHCGTMVYLGDALPDKYRNTLFTNNIHGRRINNDLPRRSGSGYVAAHGPDLLRSRDPWFMGVTLAYGPSGEIYVSDWSDTGECHSTRNTRKETGRIYRLDYGKPRSSPANLNVAQLPSLKLAELQTHRNDWYVRHARRNLHERAVAGEDMSEVHARLLQIFMTERSIPLRLRGLWALKVTGGLTEELLQQALGDSSEDVRSWAVTLLCEDGRPSPSALGEFVSLASRGESSLVRLSLASALQRLPLSDRWELVEALAAHGEDQADHNLPLMLWYACEPLVNEDLSRFVSLAAAAKIPRVRINIARRIASSAQSAQGLELLVERLANDETDESVAADLLGGVLQGIEGRRALPMPAAWPAAYARLAQSSSTDLRDQAVQLAVVFDDQAALTALHAIALNPHADAADRCRAIDALVSKRLPEFGGELLELLGESTANGPHTSETAVQHADHAATNTASPPSVVATALRGLAVYSEAGTPTALLSHYDHFSGAEKQLALATLASRPGWALQLLDALESEAISLADVTAFTARQLRELGDEQLTARVAKLWGTVRETPNDRARQIASIKKWLTPEAVRQADLAAGEKLFQQHCAACHQFFGAGAGNKIGPDLSGAQRTNLDYMLENIIDPSASVAKDYQMEVLQTIDGRVLTGLIESSDPRTLIVQTATERLVVPVEEVEARKQSSQSIMPQGLLDSLTDDQIRDLFGYLQR